MNIWKSIFGRLFKKEINNMFPAIAATVTAIKSKMSLTSRSI